MKDYTLEVCVDSVESAIAAQKGGANRLELCASLVIGGTSPSLCLFQQVKQECSIKINVLLRPRFGDFCYSKHEFEILRKEVQLFREAGADGIVIGCLNPFGDLDMDKMEILCQEAGKMNITLHRAFDMCQDPIKTLGQVKELGIDTILTSGQKQTCLQGISLLAQLVKSAGKDVAIMAGGSVCADIIPELYHKAGISTFHMSGKKVIESPMKYRNPQVNMGLKEISEYSQWVTDAEKVAAAKEVIIKL